MPYGVPSSMWIRLPPDDQAAIQATALGLPIPRYAPAPATTAYVAPTNATTTSASPSAATAAPPATLKGTPVKVKVTAAKKNAEEVAHTLAAKEGRVQTVAGSKTSVGKHDNRQYLGAQTTDARAHPRPPGSQAQSPTGTAVNAATEAAKEAQSAHRHGHAVDVLARTLPASRAHPTAPFAQTAHRHGEPIFKPASRSHTSPPQTQSAHRHDEPVEVLARTRPASRAHPIGDSVGPARSPHIAREREQSREGLKSEIRARRLDAIREELTVDEHGHTRLVRVRGDSTDRAPNLSRRLELQQPRIKRTNPRTVIESPFSDGSKHPSNDRRARDAVVAANKDRFLDYVRRFAQHYNPTYEVSRGTWGAVDDCTNFVSQALHFGGWAEDKTWAYEKATYIPDYAAGGFPARVGGPGAAWENVNQFVHYAVQSGRAQYLVLTNRRDIRPGDILVIDWHGSRPGTNDFHPDHLDIVTRIGDVGGKRQVYVGSHGGSPNTDHTHFPFFDIPGVTSDSQQQREPRVTFAVLRPKWK